MFYRAFCEVSAMVRPFKACLGCLRLFRKPINQSDEDFARQPYCPKCSKDHLVIEPDESKFFTKKKVDLLAAKVDRVIDKPERKEPEPLPKKPVKRGSGGRNEYVYAKMNSLTRACEIYADRNNLPIELARKLWKLQ